MTMKNPPHPGGVVLRLCSRICGQTNVLRQGTHMYIKEGLRFRIGGAAPKPPEFSALWPEWSFWFRLQ